MQFRKCVCCQLELPLSVLTPVEVRHQGRKILTLICNVCKKLKQEEAIRRQNENS
jgi:hypothetical protein